MPLTYGLHDAQTRSKGQAFRTKNARNNIFFRWQGVLPPVKYWSFLFMAVFCAAAGAFLRFRPEWLMRFLMALPFKLGDAFLVGFTLQGIEPGSEESLRQYRLAGIVGFCFAFILIVLYLLEMFNVVSLP